jgi:mannose-6-phosphate isomerase-like protein (cupin superfamily)
MVPEAPLHETDEGLAPGSPGWFVINAREARWRKRPERGHSLPLSGWSDEECETHFTQLGVNLLVLGPGEPMSIYHWETDAEGFFVIAGEPLLIMEGEERQLRQYDYVHCPPHAKHVIVGAGERPCVVLAMSSRQFMATPEWGGYSIDEKAGRYNANPPEETNDSTYAYERFAPSVPTRYREGWLP